jgi:ribosomal protein S18 acetylase RimI-like enzyme
MKRKQIPTMWKTDRLMIENSRVDDVPKLQHINDAVPQTQSWMQGEGQENPTCSMLQALQEGALPPIPNKSKEYFRLQSIRMIEPPNLIGFLAVYHGFPTKNVFWITTVTFHPDFQGKGYGPELLSGLIGTVENLGDYGYIRSYVHLRNWPSLRLCVKVGLTQMVEIVGDKIFSKEADAYVLVEKSFDRP